MEELQEEVAEGNGPLMEFRAGSLIASVWNNDVDTNDGRIVGLKSVQIGRLYKDCCDHWQTTSSFRLKDVPVLVILLQQLYQALAVTQE